jgi:hypothetical protein
VKADAMEEFDDREDFEITFFSGMHRGGIDDGIAIFDVVDFMRREGRMNNILREIKEGEIIVFLDGDIGMDRETAMVPGAHFINQNVTDTIMVFKHGKDFFAKDNVSLRGIDTRERMEVAGGIKNAISNEAMDMGMPGEKITKGLDGEDEARFV